MKMDPKTWEKVDWTKTNTKIAKELGVDPGAIPYQRRKRAPDTLAPSVAKKRAIGRAGRNRFRDFHGFEPD